MKQFLFLLVALFAFNAVAGTVYFPISNITLSAPSNAQVLYYKDADKAMAYSNVIDLMSVATGTVSGYLSNTDWSLFNGKQDSIGYTPIGTVTAGTGLSGGGTGAGITVSADFTATQARVSGTCAASQAVKAIAQNGSVTCEAMTATPNHNDLSGLDGGSIGAYFHMTSAEHTIATQAATGTVSGYLSYGDWTIFNGKAPAFTVSAPIENNSNVLSMSAAASGIDGYLTSGDWATFSGKQDTLPAASNTISGYLTYTDWITFNGKVGSVGAGTGISISGSATAPVVNVVASSVQTRVSGTCAGAIGVIAEGGTVTCRSIPTIGRYVQDLAFNGTDLSKNVSVSASITDARNAIIQLKQDANDYEITGVSIKSFVDSVTITTTVPLPAGNYNLIVLE
jgi:hypothetical protein